MTDKRIPDAWLHQVADCDGEPDMALSFAEDSFPFDGVCGYRSLSRQPLYTAPPSVDALIAEIDAIECEYLDDYEVEVKKVTAKYRSAK